MSDQFNAMQAGTLSAEDYAQQQQINRQQRFADMLMAQNQQPQGQMISGRYVAPSFFQMLNPVANMLAGAYIGKRGDEEATKLAEKIRTGRAAGEQKITNLAFGTPDVATEVAGPYAGNVPMPVAVKEGSKPDYAAALREINNPANYGAGKDIKPMLYKQMMPDPTPEEKRFKAAVADGSWNVQKQGGLNAFLNQMSEKDKASLAIDRARLGIAQQELAFNTGMPMGGVGAPQVAPQGTNQYQTINQGSPILATGQQVAPQQGNMLQQGNAPIFKSKADQDIYVATQKEKGRLQAEAQNALPAALLTAQTGIDTIKELIGDTKVDAKGNIVYGKQAPKAGFEAAVGMPSFTSGLGIANLFPASEAADFKAAFEQVGGQAFLGAISTLKGSGAISEVEGSKATSALNRMKLSQSEVEFIKAANDFKGVLEKGYKAAQQRAGTAPINPSAPLSAGGAKKLVYNPQTGTLE